MQMADGCMRQKKVSCTCVEMQEFTWVNAVVNGAAATQYLPQNSIGRISGFVDACGGMRWRWHAGASFNRTSHLPLEKHWRQARGELRMAALFAVWLGLNGVVW